MAGWEIHSIEQADQRLKEWIAENSGTACSLGAPSARAEGEGVSLYLVDIRDSSYLAAANQLPLQLTLRYLVTTWAASPEAAHQLLDTVINRALNEPQLESEFQPIPPELWMGLQVSPQPAFFLRVVLRPERARPKEAPLVRKPLVLELEPVVSLFGRVLGPQDQPIMNARVELPALELSAQTGPDGDFHFVGIPGGSGLKTRLHIRARGKAQDVLVERMYSEADPLIVHFDLPD